MIDTDKYEGNTKGDNEVGWRILGDNFVVNDKSPNNRFIAYAQVNNDGGHTIVGFSDADANLIADAPLLLAEVKRLREQIVDMIDSMDNYYIRDIEHATDCLRDMIGYYEDEEE